MPIIPFNRPYIVGKELHYIERAVVEGHLAGDGGFTKLCHQWIAQELGIARALLTHSCTAALEMCALLVDIAPGDEVIMPSYTFVSTANAFALRGARIRFIDIRPDTLNINEDQIERAITARTKAIVPVHYAGVGAEMDAILEIASHHDLFVIEDAAQGFGARYRGRPLGGIGDLGTFSFHETKNVISGEGGALCVNREELYARAEILREKGTDRSQFLRGERDKYTWVDLGSSYLPSELTAAFLYGQLELVHRITERRHEIYSRYRDGLRDLALAGRLRLPIVPDHTEHNAHMFYVVLPTQTLRDELMAHLKKLSILSVFHYVPLHTSPMGRKVSAETVELPVTEDLSGRLLRLPCYFELDEGTQNQVIGAIDAYLSNF